MGQNYSSTTKGSVGNPYTHSEFLTLFNAKQWRGGFVSMYNNGTKQIVYVFEDGCASRPKIWDIDGSKFTTGSDFFSSDTGTDSGSGSGSGCSTGSSEGSGSGSCIESENQPRVEIFAGSKTKTFETQSYSLSMSFKWTDGFFFENSKYCTSEMQYAVNRLDTYSTLSGYTIEVGWDAPYLILIRIKLVFENSELNPISIYEYVRIEQTDLNKRGY